MRYFSRTAVYICLSAALFIAPVSAQNDILPPNQGFSSIVEIMNQSCVSCHSWAGTYEGLTDSIRHTPSQPEQSPLYLLVENDSMPIMDPKLTLDQKNLIKYWIAAGSPETDEPITVVQKDESESTITVTETTTMVADAVDYEKLGNRINSHMITGFTSSALLFAAGVVGTIHFQNMMDRGHEGEGVDADDLPDENEHGGDIRKIWGGRDEQILRWTHVGLLVAGEALYMYDAITGLTFPPENTQGITPRKIHRLAFYAHAALMATNAVMGFLTTSVLSQGSHNDVHNYAVAHAIIGFAVPTVILGSGVAMVLTR